MTGGYILTLEAEADLRGIIRYTRQQWSAEQVRIYIAKLERGIDRLVARQGAFKGMSDLYPKLLMAHCEHHYVFSLPRERAPALIVASIRSMIDFLTPRVKRVLVMSIPPWVGEEFGTANRAKLDACNGAIQAAFPEFWLDISAWLRTEQAATAAGIAFTSDDLTDIANGLTPRSLRSDSGHPNAGGNVAIGHRVYQESQFRGWM